MEKHFAAFLGVFPFSGKLEQPRTCRKVYTNSGNDLQGIFACQMRP